MDHLLSNEMASIQPLTPGDHAVLLTGSLYKKKLSLLARLGASAENSVVFSQWAGDEFADWTVIQDKSIVDKSMRFQKQLQAAQAVKNKDPLAPRPLPPHTFLIVDEVNLRIGTNAETVLPFLEHGRFTFTSVVIIQMSIRYVPLLFRANCLFFAALGRFQQEKIFRVVFPLAPLAASSNLLVHWCNQKPSIQKKPNEPSSAKRPLTNQFSGKPFKVPKKQRKAHAINATQNTTLLPSSALMQHDQAVQNLATPSAPRLDASPIPTSPFVKSMTALSLEDTKWHQLKKI